jgi:hypothetical protein
MSDMQTCSGWVWKHVENVILGLIGIVLNFVDTAFLPDTSPLFFNTLYLFFAVIGHFKVIKGAKISIPGNLLPPFIGDRTGHISCSFIPFQGT